MTKEPIPFLDLVTLHREIEEELVGVFREAIRSAQFIGGPQLYDFEREFAEYCGTRYCVGVSSGTDALRLALMATGVGAGDAVVTVAHTFIATVEAITQAGAEAEFVDIDSPTYLLSARRLEEYLAGCCQDPVTGRPLGQRTRKPIKCIVPVHLYGQIADMDALGAIAERYGLTIVEDACQAHGAVYLSRRDNVWRRAGSFGAAAAFSFYPGKNLGACGEAGAVTTDDEAMAQRIRMLRDHGQQQKYYHDVAGYNGRLDAIQAAFLRIKLRRLDEWNDRRRLAAFRYSELLPNERITTPYEPPTSRSAFHLYVIRTPDRTALARHLAEQGIQTGMHYPLPVHLQHCYRSWGYAPGALPVTEQVAAEILSLPMYPGLTAEHQQRVAAEVESFVTAGVRR